MEAFLKLFFFIFIQVLFLMALFGKRKKYVGCYYVVSLVIIYYFFLTYWF